MNFGGHNPEALRSALLQTRLAIQLIDRERDAVLAQQLVGFVDETPRAASANWPAAEGHPLCCDCDNCLNGKGNDHV